MQRILRTISKKYIIIGSVAGLFLTMMIEYLLYLKFVDLWENPITYYGYHVHHSVYGLLSMCFGLFFIKKPRLFYFLMGLGVGIIIAHTINDGRFVFID
jgi:hypothetical protein